VIIDKLNNSELYSSYDLFKTAFDFLKTLNETSEEKRYELGNGIYAVIESYMTKPEEDGKLEAHRKFIDIQMVLAGREKIGWNNITGLAVDTPYNIDKDIVFFKSPKQLSSYTKISNGTFMLLFPEDGHMPQLQVADKPELVKKVVVKIDKELLVKT